MSKRKEAYQRSKRQPYWIVERCNNENDTLGFLVDRWFHKSEVETEGWLLGLSPLLDVLVGCQGIPDRSIDFDAKFCQTKNRSIRRSGHTHNRLSRAGLPKSDCNAFSILSEFSWTRYASCRSWYFRYSMDLSFPLWKPALSSAWI